MSTTAVGRLVAIEAIGRNLGPPAPWGRTVEVGVLPALLAAGVWVGQQLALWFAVDTIAGLILPGDEQKEAAGPMPSWGQRTILRTQVVARMLKANTLTGERSARLLFAAKAADKILADPSTTLFVGEMTLRQLDLAIGQLQAAEQAAASVPGASVPSASGEPGGGEVVPGLGTIGRPRNVWPWLVGGAVLLGVVVWARGRK